MKEWIFLSKLKLIFDIYKIVIVENHKKFLAVIVQQRRLSYIQPKTLISWAGFVAHYVEGAIHFGFLQHPYWLVIYLLLTFNYWYVNGSENSI